MMERHKSTRSLQTASPSSFPASVSVTPHAMRRSHRTPTSTSDIEVGGVFSRLAEPRSSPHQRVLVNESGTPRLAAAVAEAKRSGAAAPSPDILAAPMDQFDRLLAQNIGKIHSTSTPVSPAVHIGPHGRETESPSVLKAVHNVLADDVRRRDVMAQIARIINDTAQKANASRTTPRGQPASRGQPSPRGQQGDRSSEPLFRLARAVRDISPLDSTPVSGRQRHTPRERCGIIDREFSPKTQHFDPTEVQAFTKGAPPPSEPFVPTIHRPTPSERRLSKSQLMQLQTDIKPSKKKVIRSATSDFVETNTDETGSIGSSLHAYRATHSRR